MPKVLLGDQQRAEDRLRKNLRLIQGNRNSHEMALKIGAKSHETWRRRILHPETLTLQEARILCTNFGIDLGAFVAGTLTIKGA